MTAAASIVTLSSSANPVTTCKPVVFSITVNGASSTMPTGEVALTKGSTVLATATLRRGVARVRTRKLASGENMRNATYKGNAKYPAVTSAPFRQMMATGCK